MGENEENQVITFLEGLSPADFARVVVRVLGAIHQVPNGVSAYERATALVNHVRSSSGMGMEQLVEEVLKPLFPEHHFPLLPNTRLVQEYLQAFITKIEHRLKEMLHLSARDTPGAIAPSPEKLSYLILPALLAEEPSSLSLPQDQFVFNTFTEAFEKREKRVLLLGVPGGGKTTTLLQFACETARQCQSSIYQPVPLFASIYQWDHEKSVKEWAQALVKEAFPGIDLTKRPLLYLFDGLDELGSERPIDPQKPEGEKYDPRLRFLQAVAEELPDAQVVISCRELDYEQIGEKAKLRGAVKLLPLNPNQIRTFLMGQNQGAFWTNLEQDEHLLKLAETPLLLALLSKSIGSANSLPTADASSLNANTIFDFYIRMMFVHEGQKRELPFTEADTRSLLGKLAAAMWQRWSSSILLDWKTVQTTLGKDYQAFIQFACDMQFLRASSNTIQFVHLKFRDFCAVPVLIAALKDKDSYVRGRTVEALGEIRDTSVVPSLIAALKDKNRYVRSMAADALVKIGDASVVPSLIAALKDEDSYVRGRVADALVKIGVPAVPSLVGALKDEDSSVREMAALALGKIGDASAVPSLIAALNDKDRYVRGRVADALVKIGVPAVPSLVGALKDKDSSVREMAALALRGIGDASAVPSLIAALNDKDRYVRGRVADALVKIGDASVVPSLTAALKDEDSSVRGRVASALGRIGDASAVPSLTAALKDEHSSVRGRAAGALGRIGDASAVPSLTAALKDEHSSVRGRAAEALKLLSS